MGFHKDLSMFSPDCLELVLTLSNESDSNFNGLKMIIKRRRPNANTLCIVKPQTVVHGVSPTNNGTRRILKFIIEFENSIKSQDFTTKLIIVLYKKIE